MSHDVFISYSRRDTERMQQIRDGLYQAGLTIWTDEGIEPGTESWKKTISDAIMECTSFVVLFSPDAAQSTWVNRELDFAELHGKKIYPLLVRGDERTALPFGYTTFQFIDIRNDETLHDGITDLISILSKNYRERNLENKAHLRVSLYENTTDLVRLSEPVAADSRTHWLLHQADKFLMFVPSTFKIMEPTHDAIARMFLLHQSVENIENLMFQFIRDESNFANIATGIRIPFTGVDTTIERTSVFVDVSGLSVLSGFVNVINYPLSTRDWFVSRISMNMSLNNLSNYMEIYNAREFERKVIKKHGRHIAVVLHCVDNYIICQYFVIVFRTKIIVHILFIAEENHHQQNQEVMQIMAESVQIT